MRLTPMSRAVSGLEATARMAVPKRVVFRNQPSPAAETAASGSVAMVADAQVPDRDRSVAQARAPRPQSTRSTVPTWAALGRPGPNLHPVNPARAAHRLEATPLGTATHQTN